MRDLPRPGIKPVSPALAGRFLTTVPLGKSWPYFNCYFCPLNSLLSLSPFTSRKKTEVTAGLQYFLTYIRGLQSKETGVRTSAPVQGPYSESLRHLTLFLCLCQTSLMDHHPPSCGAQTGLTTLLTLLRVAVTINHLGSAFKRKPT